ncbi:10994_t:CDS:2 [Dentiscutata erythropus]|uniref:10994_t:CDS:1 n=1 Tax=Dentiscutata erythropus TaxID=1348616 RepID=A0A9N8ZSC7_9GLOM|nr:10994_t:CDS:2 [Dentiscutata erythropus]
MDKKNQNEKSQSYTSDLDPSYEEMFAIPEVKKHPVIRIAGAPMILNVNV